MFKDKDPIIDVMRTLAQDSHLPYEVISEKSGVSRATLYNWFHGATRRPQFCTIAAVAGALGKSVGLVPKKR
jgi:transcriptional regulator with XRE-family HTH domain